MKNIYFLHQSITCYALTCCLLSIKIIRTFTELSVQLGMAQYGTKLTMYTLFSLVMSYTHYIIFSTTWD